MRYVAVFCLVSILSILPAASAEPGRDNQQTLSPYFFIQDGDAETDRLPLESTSVEARIAAVFAEVTVRQVYKNEGNRTLEAVYVFPASTRAAVHGMRMKIGDRTIVAEIRERDRARRRYEDARGQGRTAALLEQNRSNVFQMNVSNILPGDRIEVELEYSELLEPTLGVYEFVYPTVVGPRYSNTSEGEATDRDKWVGSPYRHEGEAPWNRLDISVDVAAGMPIQEVDCPTHQVITKFNGRSEVSLRLAPAEKAGGNRDFVLRYRLAGDGIASGLLVEEGPEENYFLLMLQPPKRVQPEAIPPREYLFVIDVSGSMQGFPHDTSIELTRELIGALRDTDYFNVLYFAGDSYLLSESSLPATAANVRWALQEIEAKQAGGATELLPALRRALALPQAEKTVSRTLLVITDGFVDVEREAFRLIRDNLNQANVFAFGMGASVNRYLIEGMARAGWGQPFVVTDPSQAQGEADRFREYVSAPVLTDVHAVVTGLDAYDMEPPFVPDLFAQRPLVLLGKWRGNAGKIGVEGLSTRGVWSRAMAVKTAWRVPEGMLARLWARRYLALLADYGDPEDKATRQMVTELGLRHGLLTEFTSFVAVDTVIRTGGGAPVRVEQPLPLPEGVEDSAIGVSITRSGSGSQRSVILAQSPKAARAAVPLGVARAVIGGTASTAPSSASQYTRIGGNVAAAHLRQRVDPVLPELARQARVQGIVLLQVEIDAEGNVEKVHLIKGHPLLNEAAIEAVKQWKYEPIRLNGQPVPVITTVTVGFWLK